MADRFTYLPLVGLFLIAAWGAAQAARGMAARRVVSALAVAVVLVFAVVARAQASVWATSETLWQHAIDADADDYLAEDALGSLISRARSADALAHFQRAVAIRPSFARGHFNLGLMLMTVGRLHEAGREFRAALADAPPTDPTMAAAHHQLGRVLAFSNDAPGAVRELQSALQLEPSNAAVHRDLGSALFTEGRHQDAEREYTAALRLDPTDAETYRVMGVAALTEGRADEAITDFGAAIQVRPDLAGAWDNRGAVLGQQGRLPEAIRDFTEAVRLQPTFVLAQLHDGLALAAAGRSDEAAIHLRAVLQLDPANDAARRALVQIGR